MNEIKWHSIKKEGFPEKEGDYLVTVIVHDQDEIYKTTDILGFTNDLNGIFHYDDLEPDYKNKKGFFGAIFNGYYEDPHVIAWANVGYYDGE